MSEVGGFDDGHAPMSGQGQTQGPKLPGPWVLKANNFLGAAAFACLAKYLPVFYTGIGIDVSVIGVLGSVGMVVTFCGQLFWGWVIDKIGGNYKLVLASTQFIATVTLLMFCFDVVQQSIHLVFIVACTTTFFNSTGGSIIDALCMRVLDEYKNVVQASATTCTCTPRTRRNAAIGAKESYGDQRLYSAVGWGGMSLIMGYIIDVLGLNMMFVGFAVIQGVNIFIVLAFLPSLSEDEKKQREQEQAQVSAADGQERKGFCTAKVFWFFSNLLMYGIAMSLIENFLFIYLIQDFKDTANVVLGVSTTVMCIFEIPVFRMVSPWLEQAEPGNESRMTMVLLFCQLITAFRCWLYVLIPYESSWMSIFISPLHGVCFAAMWVASMEYAKRLAGKKNLAKMTALVNGIYYSVSMGVGTFGWGLLVDKQTGVGFVNSFYIDLVLLVVWAGIYQLGLLCLGGNKGVAVEGARETLNDLPQGS